jgi:hypothetical protein
MASVIIPAGFVKLTTYASGAMSATRAATLIATGMVRSPNAMPPGPAVS